MQPAPGRLSVAAFLDGDHAQAFPSFGPERTGAPVVGFSRIDDREIRVREPIVAPDALIVQDPFQMGYRGVYAMEKVLNGEKVEPRVVEIPAQVVTAENVDEPQIQELLNQ